MGAVLGEFGGGKIDGNFAIGEGETRVGDGRTDALAGFGDGFVGHADEIKAGEAAMHIALNGDKSTGITVGNGGIDAGDLTTAHNFTIQHLRRDLQRISGLNGKKVWL